MKFRLDFVSYFAAAVLLLLIVGAIAGAVIALVGGVAGMAEVKRIGAIMAGGCATVFIAFMLSPLKGLFNVRSSGRAPLDDERIEDRRDGS